jgi:hypothetical protein
MASIVTSFARWRSKSLSFVPSRMALVFAGGDCRRPWRQ